MTASPIPSAVQAQPEEQIPPRIYWAPLADNFYDADGNGQGNDFYLKWKPRRAEFPQGVSFGWGKGSAYNPFKDAPRKSEAATPSVQTAAPTDEHEAFYEGRLRAVLDVIQRYLPPDSPLTEHQAMNEIIGLVDPWPAPIAASSAATSAAPTDEREAFEASNVGRQLLKTRVADDRRYESMETEFAWLGWCEGRRAASTPAKEAVATDLLQQALPPASPVKVPPIDFSPALQIARNAIKHSSLASPQVAPAPMARPLRMLTDEEISVIVTGNEPCGTSGPYIEHSDARQAMHEAIVDAINAFKLVNGLDMSSGEGK